MRKFNLKRVLETEIRKKKFDWNIKGLIDGSKNIYTLDSDTKLISKVLELIISPVILNIKGPKNMQIVPANRQTVYPDFTFVMPDNSKIALDIKSTYRRNQKYVNGFTLGSYMGYLRNPTKNIMFPYNEYKEHWVLGFIYSRPSHLKAEVVSVSRLAKIRPALDDLEVILEPKYKLSSQRPGSGNTTNIGSITEISLLKKGQGPFAEHGLAVFEDYWCNFVSTREASNKGIKQPYTNIKEYFEWKKRQSGG